MTSERPDPPAAGIRGGTYGATPASDAPEGTGDSPRRLSRFVGYGILRTAVEGIFGARGVVLAAILGVEWFGLWALVRIGQHYAALAGIGLIRGLEVEVSATRETGRSDASVDALDFGRATLAYFLLVFGVLTLCCAVAAILVPYSRASIVFGGLALGVLIERVWLYAASFMRARGLLWSVGWCELSNAFLHLVLTTAFAWVYGIWGAFVGFLLAHLTGVALTSPHVPLLPRWSGSRIATLARIGFPVSISQFLYTAMTSVDRLVVGAFLGIEALGFYAFAVAVSGFGAVIGFAIRTVLFPDVFRMARRIGPDASTDYLDLTLFPFSWILAPVFGLVALALGPAIELWLPTYAEAVPAARIFMFIGIVQGLNLVADLGVVAHERQRRLPIITGGAVAMNLVFAIGCVTLGLGLEALAAAALVTRLAHVLILILAGRRAMAWRARLHIAATVLTPILVSGGLVVVLSRIFPTANAAGFMMAIVAYLVCVAVLAPGVVRGLRAAMRLRQVT